MDEQLPNRPEIPQNKKTFVDRWIEKIFKSIEKAAGRAIDRDPHTIASNAELQRLYKQIAASGKRYRDKYPDRVKRAEKELRDENPFYYDSRYNGESDKKPKKK